MSTAQSLCDDACSKNRSMRRLPSAVTTTAYRYDRESKREVTSFCRRVMGRGRVFGGCLHWVRSGPAFPLPALSSLLLRSYVGRIVRLDQKIHLRVAQRTEYEDWSDLLAPAKAEDEGR
jgi:hypothetical protein